VDLGNKKALQKAGHNGFVTSSPIQTILSALESNQINLSVRGLYRRWGITPRPEDYSIKFIITEGYTSVNGFTLFSSEPQVGITVELQNSKQFNHEGHEEHEERKTKGFNHSPYL
jgi:hypothetical protein